MQIRHVILKVDDQDKALAFWKSWASRRLATTAAAAGAG